MLPLMKWVLTGTPTHQGWYAVLHRQEDELPTTVARWDGAWPAGLEIHGYAGPFASEDEAEVWSVDEDPGWSIT